MSETMQEEKFPTMTGDARMARGAGRFTVPLFSHITGNLWTGFSPAELDWYFTPGHQPGKDWLMDNGHPRFLAILNLYPWGEYIVPEGVEYMEAELYDSDDEISDSTIKPLAEWVIQQAGSLNRKTLVHCQAGLNRSALVVARALILLGTPAQEAIGLLRDKRSPTVLCNENFENFLLRLKSGT